MAISIQHAASGRMAATGHLASSPAAGSEIIAGLDFSALLSGQLAGNDLPTDLSAAISDMEAALTEKPPLDTVDRDQTSLLSDQPTDLLQSILASNAQWAPNTPHSSLSKLPLDSGALTGEGKWSADDLRSALSANTASQAGFSLENAVDRNKTASLASPLLPLAGSERSLDSNALTGEGKWSADDLRSALSANTTSQADFSLENAVDRNKTASLASPLLALASSGKDDSTAKIAVSDSLIDPQSLPATTSALPTASPRDNMASHNLPTPLHSSQWGQDFSNRVVWIARNEQQSAQININPAHLGPIQINLSLQGDQMSASFISAHSEVRQAIEEAMPRLRDMLSGSGIALGDTSVGAQLAQQQREQSPRFANPPRLADENAILGRDGVTSSVTTSLPIQRGQGLVDLFA